MSSEMPSFGPTVAPVYNVAPIQVNYIRNGAVETQEFTVLDKPIDIGTALRLLLAGAISDANALPGMIRLIGQHMANDDGVPATWEFKEMPSKKDEPDVIRFRAPTGKILPVEKASEYTDPTKGSSRRRWLYLMNEDESAEIEIETIQGLLKYVTEVAAKRPTHASS